MATPDPIEASDDEVRARVRRWVATAEGQDFVQSVLAERCVELLAALGSEREAHERTKTVLKKLNAMLAEQGDQLIAEREARFKDRRRRRDDLIERFDTDDLDAIGRSLDRAVAKIEELTAAAMKPQSEKSS